LAEAEFGRMWEKWPNFGFAEAEAEIRCNPTVNCTGFVRKTVAPPPEVFWHFPQTIGNF